MPRVLLLLPTATYRAEDFLAAAATVSAEVVVASDRRQALHGAMGDRALRVDMRRPDRAAAAIVELAGRTPLDAVVAVDDGGVAAAALASERLGLAAQPTRGRRSHPRQGRHAARVAGGRGSRSRSSSCSRRATTPAPSICRRC